ncbi:MAG: hypothetical protein ABW164_11355 [Sphingobium sp.]
MTVRSTRSLVTFAAPFHLPGFDAPLPAGIYPVDTDEETIEGTGRTVFRRIATTLVVEMAGRVEYRAVDPKDLEAALQQDREAAAALPPDAPPPEAPDASMPPVGWRWVPLWVRVPWSGKGV